MLHFGLNLIDPGDVEAAFLPDRPSRFLWDHAQFGQRVGGVCLDLEPDLETGFGFPDLDHVWAGIAGNHRMSLQREGLMRRPLTEGAAGFKFLRSCIQFGAGRV